MQTSMLFFLTLSLVSQLAYATDPELEVYYKNKPQQGIYKINIQPVPGTDVYDGSFNPVPRTNTTVYNGVNDKNMINFNAVYSNA